MLPIIFLAFSTLAFAGRAPYLGGDLGELMEETKRSGISSAPHVQRPVTAQQKEDYNRYHTKFTDIAKAYAEGYKAAIKAVQARALIAQKRIQANHLATQIYPKSNIPLTPKEEPLKASVNSNGAFNMPVPNEVTVNGMEKSGIPHPNPLESSSLSSSFADHKVVERSAPFQPEISQHIAGFATVPLDQLSEEKRNEISKLNYAARHRNVYFDQPGGVTRQNVIFEKKHRRRRSLDRLRRSRMPYLGQNLDALGVVRATIDWNEKPKKKAEMPYAPQAVPAKSVSAENAQVPNQEVARSNVPVQLSQGYFYGQMYNNPYQQRSIVPTNTFQMQAPFMAYSNPYYAGFIPNQIPRVEDVAPGMERSKKSAAPEPDVAVLNYAARHRNVYLDSVSGDPYGGGNAVLSRQNVLFQKP